MQKAESTEYDIGLIGLGVIGRSFVMNLADHGFRCHVSPYTSAVIWVLRDS